MSVNIFRDSTTSAVGERLSNIQDENVTAESVLLLQTNNNTDVVPVSTYGKTLLNSISLAQLKADLDGSPTAVSVNDSGTGEINMTIDGDANLRLQVKNTETNLYNELKLHNGAVNGGLKMNSTTLETKSNSGKVLVEGVINGVELKKAGNMILNGTSDNLTLHKPSNGDTKMTIGGNVDFATNIIGTGHNIGASGFNWDNVYSNTNNSNNYKIQDAGTISIGGANPVTLFRFLRGPTANLSNDITLYQLPADDISRFCENGSVYNMLEFDTITNNINIGETAHATILNTCNILPIDDLTYDIGSSLKRYDNLYIDQGQVGGVAISSDKTLKNSIETSDLGLSFINKLNPVKYKYNNKKRIHYGLISQELREVLDTDNISMWGVDKQTNKEFIQYMELICPTIKALQQLDKKVEDNLSVKEVVLEAVEKLQSQTSQTSQPQQEDQFSNIKNLLKSMNKEEPVLEAKGSIECDCSCNIDRINILNERLSSNYKDLSNNYNDMSEKYSNILAQVEELKTIIETKHEVEEVEEESDNGGSVLDIIQQRLFEIERKQTKMDNKLKRITTIVNKIVKGNE